MKIFIPGLIMAVLLSGCNNQDAPADALKSDNSQLYAMQATSYKWPAAQPGVSVASNILATNYYLVIDGSGSMEESGCSEGILKIEVAKAAVTQFINKIPADANVGLLTFDINNVSEKVPLGLDRETILQKVTAMEVGGGTPLRSAIRGAYHALTQQALTQLGYGEYHLVVVTDGEASSGEDPLSAVNEILSNSPIVLHTIGFCIDPGHSLNIPGKTDYRSANNPEELLQGLASVLAESSEYVIDEFKQGAAAPATTVPATTVPGKAAP